MNYAEYRKKGLTVTSCMVESLIKEVNYRAKGTDKFWDNPERAEAIRLANFIAKREGSAIRKHKNREVAEAV